jgi:hypothetical protein
LRASAQTALRSGSLRSAIDRAASRLLPVAIEAAIPAASRPKGEAHEQHHACHVRVFQAIRSQLYDNITLASCTINGEPGVAIVMVDDAGEGKVAVMPLFVGITTNMQLTSPGEGESDGGGGEHMGSQNRACAAQGRGPPLLIKKPRSAKKI